MQLSIDRRDSISRDEFFERYYTAYRPVIHTGYMRDWPANTKWTPEYLRSLFGEEIVEVMTGRNTDPDYEIRSSLRKTQMRFSDYIDMCLNCGETNDIYLCAQNEFTRKAVNGHKLYDDITLPIEYTDSRRDGFVFFWYGPAGTVTPLHHDACDIFLGQVQGRKRITMIPREQKPLLYNHIGVFSQVDVEKPDLVRFPLYEQATKYTFDLNPGEAIYIPGGWWHHVRALDVSISISFTNFHGPMRMVV